MRPLAQKDLTRQRIRLRRFLLAGATSLLYLVVLAAFRLDGRLDDATLLLACAAVAAFIAGFLVLFVTGLNLRARDPSLTTYQMLAALTTMLVVIYRAPDTRIVFGAFFFVALTFGLLRSSGVRLSALGVGTLLVFAAVSLARYVRGGSDETLRLDVLQLVTLCVALPWFVFVGSLARRLREADRRKDEFMATLAHELRNPLAPMRTGVEILRSAAGPARVQTVLPVMERQIAHITRLLDDLLDISRIARGRTELSLQTVNLRNAVASAVDATAPLMAEMGHRFESTLHDEPLMLEADPLRLTQILSNLLANAAKYTPRGGRIELVARRAGDLAEIRVRDDGVGIPRERLGSIFDRYAQIEDQAARQRGGLGIGLALARELAILHGGTIEAHSEGEGRGSEFVVRLPLRQGGIRPTARRAAPNRRRDLARDFLETRDG